MKIVESKESTILKNSWSRVGISKAKFHMKFKGNLARNLKDLTAKYSTYRLVMARLRVHYCIFYIE